MYARIVVVAEISRVNELLVGEPFNFAVARTAAIAFPIGVLARTARNVVFRKRRRFMSLLIPLIHQLGLIT
jgi:hypothetical protein